MHEFSSKLSSATKRFLIQMPDVEHAEASFLIRIEGELDDDRRLQLAPLVTEIRSVAGDVVVVVAPVDAISRLADLDFVAYVEASGSLFTETSDSGNQLDFGLL